jgi:hypothetical protein
MRVLVLACALLAACAAPEYADDGVHVRVNDAHIWMDHARYGLRVHVNAVAASGTAGYTPDLPVTLDVHSEAPIHAEDAPGPVASFDWRPTPDCGDLVHLVVAFSGKTTARTLESGKTSVDVPIACLDL